MIPLGPRFAIAVLVITALLILDGWFSVCHARVVCRVRGYGCWVSKVNSDAYSTNNIFGYIHIL